MNFKQITKSIKEFLIGEKMPSELTNKDAADQVKEAKIKADQNLEGVVDDETDGVDAEDVSGDETEEISSDEIMKLCESELIKCDYETRKFYSNMKVSYDEAKTEELKNKIALTVNNKIFKLNN